jgi:hypothetical protein
VFEEEGKKTMSSRVRNELSVNKRPMPDPKLFFRVFLEKSLEYGVLDYIVLSRNIPPVIVFETMKDDAPNRARIYEACTGYAAKFGIKKSFEQQADDITGAIETDEKVAEIFVLAVGIDYYIEHVPLHLLYEAIMLTGWIIDSRPEYRAFAALMNETAVELTIFNGIASHTYEQILKAITFEQIVGDKMPAKLRARMFIALNEQAHKPGKLERLAPVIFGAVSFKEMSEVLDVAVMASPIVLYAEALGLVQTTGPKASEAPPPPPEDDDGRETSEEPADDADVDDLPDDDAAEG